MSKAPEATSKDRKIKGVFVPRGIKSQQTNHQKNLPPKSVPKKSCPMLSFCSVRVRPAWNNQKCGDNAKPTLAMAPFAREWSLGFPSQHAMSTAPWFSNSGSVKHKPQHFVLERAEVFEIGFSYDPFRTPPDRALPGTVCFKLPPISR